MDSHNLLLAEDFSGFFYFIVAVSLLPTIAGLAGIIFAGRWPWMGFTGGGISLIIGGLLLASFVMAEANGGGVPFICWALALLPIAVGLAAIMRSAMRETGG